PGVGPAGPLLGQKPGADGAVTKTIALGMTPEKRHYITCKPIPPVPVELRLTLIPAGQFVMGDPRGEPDERQPARVRIERPFWMGVLEVSNAQYSVFDAAHDSRCIDMELKDQEHPGYPVNHNDQPVVRVSWREAAAFCKWLSETTGGKFALPTEAQWEWACRAGTSGPLWYGDVQTDFATFANLSDVSMKKFALERFRPRIAANPVPEHAFIPKVETVDDKHQVSAPVGSYKPNAWGLYDMHGNVAEWTCSAYKPYPYTADDGRNDPAAGGKRVARGGSWFDRPCRARSAFRLAYESYQKVFNVGFRVVMEAE
ncbi:MAG: SUMF1/EgtB/PvdO family nonheme iron enzyme, partial [Phycisphaerae bacterium]